MSSEAPKRIRSSSGGAVPLSNRDLNSGTTTSSIITMVATETRITKTG